MTGYSVSIRKIRNARHQPAGLKQTTLTRCPTGNRLSSHGLHPESSVHKTQPDRNDVRKRRAAPAYELRVNRPTVSRGLGSPKTAADPSPQFLGTVVNPDPSVAVVRPIFLYNLYPVSLANAKSQSFGRNGRPAPPPGGLRTLAVSPEPCYAFCSAYLARVKRKSASRFK
jgi:hypothetical protein